MIKWPMLLADFGDASRLKWPALFWQSSLNVPHAHFNCSLFTSLWNGKIFIQSNNPEQLCSGGPDPTRAPLEKEDDQTHNVFYLWSFPPTRQYWSAFICLALSSAHSQKRTVKTAASNKTKNVPTVIESCAASSKSLQYKRSAELVSCKIAIKKKKWWLWIWRQQYRHKSGVKRAI